MSKTLLTASEGNIKNIFYRWYFIIEKEVKLYECQSKSNNSNILSCTGKGKPKTFVIGLVSPLFLSKELYSVSTCVEQWRLAFSCYWCNTIKRPRENTSSFYLFQWKKVECKPHKAPWTTGIRKYINKTNTLFTPVTWTWKK